MRLIDADTLPRHGRRGGLVEWVDIKSAPTVDAIPIEHIERMIKERKEWVDAYGSIEEYMWLADRRLDEITALEDLIYAWERYGHELAERKEE